MHIKVLACEVLAREVFHCAARSTNTFDIELYTQGLHDNANVCRETLQPRIDAASDGPYGAIVLAYGLCNNAVVGIEARQVPLVIPRAHDCITLFLGSKERYQTLFSQRPGTYYYTSGWLEYPDRGGDRVPYDPKSGLQRPEHFQFEALVEQYGEDNAQFLWESMGAWKTHYTHGAYIAYPWLADLPFADRVRQICADNAWEYLELEGDLSLLQRLLDGQWDDAAFLRVGPGQRIAADHTGGIVVAR